MNDKTKLLLPGIYTKFDLYHQVAILKEFFEYQFFSKGENSANKEMLRSFLADKESDENKEHVAMILNINDAFFDGISRENFYNTIKEITEEFESLQKINIYFSVEFSQAEIKKIGDWFRVNVAESLMMDIKVEPSIAAGCMFMWNDRYYDFSFRKMLKEKRNDIFNIVKNNGDN